MEKENTQNLEETLTTPGGGRTFTQDEVNKIIQDRLARDRATKNEFDQIDQRKKELTERENRLACKEYLLSRKLPEGLEEIFDTADSKKFQESVEKLIDIYPVIDPGAKVPRFICATPGALKDGEDNELRKAFNLSEGDTKWV